MTETVHTFVCHLLSNYFILNSKFVIFSIGTAIFLSKEDSCFCLGLTSFVELNSCLLATTMAWELVRKLACKCFKVIILSNQALKFVRKKNTIKTFYVHVRQKFLNAFCHICLYSPCPYQYRNSNGFS